jgi:hypothetical protein
MPIPGSSRTRTLAAGAILIAVLGSLSFAIAAPGRSSVRRSAAPITTTWHPRDPVYHVDLPIEEPHVPPGPYRDEFTAVCRLCHSPRLALNQPVLTEKQWNAVVHKMVAVYQAPLSAEQERHIVAYLTAVQASKR